MTERRASVRARRGAHLRNGAGGRSDGPVERAALVGLVTGSARRIEADHSLDELAGLAEAARRGGVLFIGYGARMTGVYLLLTT